MMSLSRLASRSLSRDLEASSVVIVFLSRSGIGNGSVLIGATMFLFSSGSVFFLPNRSMSVISVKGAVWPFLRIRSIPQRSLRVEGFRIINGLAEWRVLLLPRWGVGASKCGYLVFGCLFLLV